jgi:hypothetical protein
MAGEQVIAFIPGTPDFRVEGSIGWYSDMQLASLKAAMVSLIEDIDARINASTAEAQISREIARRMNNLNSQAQAAGKQSEMWTNQNSRFYKQRVAIQKGY